MEEALDQDRWGGGGPSLDKVLPELSLEEEQRLEKEQPRQKHTFVRKRENMTSRQR